MSIQQSKTKKEKRTKAIEALTNNPSCGNLSVEKAEELLIQLEHLAQISLRHLIGENKRNYEP